MNGDKTTIDESPLEIPAPVGTERRAHPGWDTLRIGQTAPCRIQPWPWNAGRDRKLRYPSQSALQASRDRSWRGACHCHGGWVHFPGTAFPRLCRSRYGLSSHSPLALAGDKTQRGNVPESHYGGHMERACGCVDACGWSLNGLGGFIRRRSGARRQMASPDWSPGVGGHL